MNLDGVLSEIIKLGAEFNPLHARRVALFNVKRQGDRYRMFLYRIEQALDMAENIHVLRIAQVATIRCPCIQSPGRCQLFLINMGKFFCTTLIQRVKSSSASWNRITTGLIQAWGKLKIWMIG